jgi:uncharacterized membrane protein (UPF0182 family)
MLMSAITGISDSAVTPRRQSHRLRRRLALAALVAVVILVLASFVARLYVDWLWFGEVGLRAIFWKRFAIGLVTGSLCAAAFFALVYGNLAVARRLAPRYRPVEGIDVVEVVHESGSRWIGRSGLLIALCGALIAGRSAAGAWLVFARAMDGVPFGVDDPVFHHDLSFYVFRLPAWEYVYWFLFATLGAALALSIVAHFTVGGIEVKLREPARRRMTLEQWERAPAAMHVADNISRLSGLHMGTGATVHVSVLAAALFLLGGLGYLFRAWSLLFSSSGVVFGAGYTDVHLRLPMIRVMMVLTFALGGALVYNAVRRRHPLWPAAAFVVWLASLIVLLGIVPAAWQALIVNPNQLAKETPYIAANIAATRAAYDLSAISQTPYSLQGDLSAASLKANRVTVDNIRLWDPQVLLRSYGQLQELRPYYSFTTVSVDRYRVNGVYTQTMLAPRELRVAGLPRQAQTWVNQHITYAHGYGVAVSAVNQVSSGGSPDFLVQDIPTVSSTPTLAIAQPQIYFGLLGTNYVLVGTKYPTFDHPGPNGDIYLRYTGSGGIPIHPLLNRLAFTLRFRDLRFFTSSAISSASRVIILNDLRARLAAAAPFLTFDSTPYMVVAGGRLFWIADAYTTTDRIPYSEPNGGLNYIRNSVKVVVDAFNGSLRFYVFDSQDPLIRTYQRMFPGVFLPASQMPGTLHRHVRYPEDYFKIQAQLFATYHVTEPSLLYNKGNQWEIPGNVSISGSAPVSAYYMIMRLPGQTREEFVLILPYAPNGRANMIAWLGAQSDLPDYGRAVSFAFPSSINVYGPAQVEAAINQDPAISAQRTLWGQQGSSVIFGNLLTVPIQNSLLYVQPLYLQSSTTALPQLQRVIVFYRSPSAAPDLPTGQQQNVVMAATLGEALTTIFGGAQPGAPQASSSTGPSSGTTSAVTAALIARADGQYAAAQAALRAGDLAAFARQIKALGRTLAQLKATP